MKKFLSKIRDIAKIAGKVIGVLPQAPLLVPAGTPPELVAALGLYNKVRQQLIDVERSAARLAFLVLDRDLTGPEKLEMALPAVIELIIIEEKLAGRTKHDSIMLETGARQLISAMATITNAWDHDPKVENIGG